MSTHHKIWSTGKEPNKRPDKGRKKPVAIRNAKKRAKSLMRHLKDGS